MDDAEFQSWVRHRWWRTPFKLVRCLLCHRKQWRYFLDEDTATKTIVIKCDLCSQWRLPWMKEKEFIHIELKPYDAFPNCPGLSESLGLQMASEIPPRFVGWGPWKKKWYSICSFHHDSLDCPRCRIGSYHNEWKHFFTSLVHDHCYWLWYWRANKGKVTLWQALKMPK